MNTNLKGKRNTMIPIVISTNSHSGSPSLTNLWQSTFASLFSMVYTPPTYKYFFCGGIIFFFFLVFCSQGLVIFQISWRPSVLGIIIFFLGEGGQAIFFHKATNTYHVNSRTVDGKVFSLRIFCLFKGPLKLSKKGLLLLVINSVKVCTLFDMNSK